MGQLACPHRHPEQTFRQHCRPEHGIFRPRAGRQADVAGHERHAGCTEHALATQRQPLQATGCPCGRRGRRDVDRLEVQPHHARPLPGLHRAGGTFRPQGAQSGGSRGAARRRDECHPAGNLRRHPADQVLRRGEVDDQNVQPRGETAVPQFTARAQEHGNHLAARRDRGRGGSRSRALLCLRGGAQRGQIPRPHGGHLSAL